MEYIIEIKLLDEAGELRAKARSADREKSWRVFYYPPGKEETPILDCPNMPVNFGTSSALDYMKAMVKTRDKTGDDKPFEKPTSTL